MEDRILEYLIYKKRNDLAILLKKCSYEFIESSSFGRAFNSYRTGLKLYSDIVTYEKLQELSHDDNEIILDAFHILYPVEENSIDLCWIESFIDPTMKIPVDNIKIENHIEKISFDYAIEQIEKIDRKLMDKDFDGAVTNSRTLLETLLKTILEKQSIEISSNDDLIKLYKKVSNFLHLDPIDYKEEYFKKILSGFFSIVQGISEIRNQHSDSHGKSKGKYYKLKEHHARLTIDSTKSICNYLFAAYKNKTGEDL